MTTAATKASGTFRVHPANKSQMISSRLWIVLRGAKSGQRRSSSRRSRRKSAHGIQVPTTPPLTVITFGVRSATLVVVRRTRSLQTKNTRMTTTTTKGATQNSRTLRRSSTSSSGEMRTLAPGGTRSCFSGRSCPSSRRYHDHSVGRRSPSRSPVTTNGRAFRNPKSSPWSLILWWRRSSSLRSSSMAEAGSTKHPFKFMQQQNRTIATSKSCRCNMKKAASTKSNQHNMNLDPTSRVNHCNTQKFYCNTGGMGEQGTDATLVHERVREKLEGLQLLAT
jgi:hypothetical protein